MIRPLLALLLVLAAGGLAVPSLAAADPPVILIDPGHGGTKPAGRHEDRSQSSSNNASSPGGLKEKDLTLEFSLILKEEILAAAERQGRVLGVLLTRERDENLDFAQRAAICDRPDSACVISIHFNAGGGGRSLGSLALVASPKRNPDYDVDRAFAAGLSAACSQGVRQWLPRSRDRGVLHDDHLHGGQGSHFFFQLQRRAHLKGKPKCFLEVEFIDNPEVEKALLSRNRADKFRQVAAPIAAYLVSWTEARASRRAP